jgi:hypothetical protein
MLLSLITGLCLAGEEDDELVGGQERVRVLVSEFQARNDSGEALAKLVESYLVAKLKGNPQLTVVRPEDLPPFQDYPARTYLESCPAGEIVGCTYVAAERGDVEWAITGTTRVLPGTSKVEISVLDIRSGKVVVSFETELEAGQDEAFAEAVARVLAEAIAGSFAERDIRNSEGEEVDMRGMSDDAVAAQLEALTQELGGASSVINRSDEVIKPPSYTMDDLVESMQGEGTKPWERLHMSPGEYLRYKNSGKTLVEWRALSSGRAGELLIRPAIGFGLQPGSSVYYGRYTYDTGSVVDSYTLSAVQNGFGAFFNLGLAYGIHPMVDLGLDIGSGTGRITMDIQQQTIGQQPLPPDQQDWLSSSFVLGPRATAGFFPVSPVRPVVSGALLFWFGDKIDNHILPPEDLALFTAPTTIVAEGMLGAEFRMVRRLDFFIHVPVDVVVGGQTYREVRGDGTADVVDIGTPPDPLSVVSAGIRAGFQVRLLGKRQSSSILDEFEEEP